MSQLPKTYRLGVEEGGGLILRVIPPQTRRYHWARKIAGDLFEIITLKDYSEITDLYVDIRVEECHVFWGSSSRFAKILREINTFWGWEVYNPEAEIMRLMYEAIKEYNQA